MNLRQLEAFRLVVSTGTTVGAARVLNLTQPSVSKLISEFERSVGIVLFRRENGRLVPTSEAEALYAEVGRAFSSLDNIAQFAKRRRNIGEGQLNILTLPSLAFNFVPRAVARVAVDFPRHSFSVGLGGDVGFGLDQLLTDKADIAVMILPVSAPGIDIIPLVDVRSVCIIPRGHRLQSRPSIDVGDLHGEPLVLVDPRYYWRQKLDEVFHRAGVAPIIRGETTSSAYACGAAAQGLGIAIVNELMANEINFQSTLIRPFTPVIWQSLGIAIQAGKGRSDVLTAMIEAMRAIAREYGQLDGEIAAVP